MNQVKIYDIAGAAGVSLATVSRVINRPEKVKKETRERVLKIIKEKGYKPNANARGLASKRSTTVAVVVPTLTRASVSEMIQGIYDSASHYGYSLRLFVLGDDVDQENAWLEIIASSVDGILLLVDEITNEFHEIIKYTPVPLIFVNSLLDKKEYGSVGIDAEKAAYELTKDLIAQGKKEIMLISSLSQATLNKSREIGYKKAMEEAHLSPNVVPTSGSLEVNRPQFQEIIKKGAPECVISTRDSFAISFMNEAVRLGVKVPDALEVIGMQNTRYAELSNPRLSCIETPVYEIGSKAMQKLTKLMQAENPGEEPIENLEVAYRFVARESTK